jgi:hypothetical protein
MATDQQEQPTRPGGDAIRKRAAQARRKAELILSRAYGLLRDPKAEWRQIRDEETTAASLMLGYVAPLAAVPPVCGLIGTLAFVRDLSTPAQAFVGAVVSFLVLMAVIFFLGYLISALAEYFEGERSDLAAMKLAAYAPTPALLMGAFSIWPDIWWLGLLGVPVSAFLLYRGLPILMKAPQDRALSYAATITVSGFIALLIMMALTSCITGVGRT